MGCVIGRSFFNSRVFFFSTLYVKKYKNKKTKYTHDNEKMETLKNYLYYIICVPCVAYQMFVK